ncbi:MAG TPA: hypothetical protein VK194_02460, partial [Candidatus Deferrimicrobium sp.]|nr:hypothetical protein [Candidatus Deferrimicrobium sp.]
MAELGQDPGRRARQERGGREADQPAGLDEVAEHGRQPLAGRRVAALPGLGELPRLLGVDEPVRRRDEFLEEQVERVVEEAVLDLRAV